MLSLILNAIISGHLEAAARNSSSDEGAVIARPMQRIEDGGLSPKSSSSSSSSSDSESELVDLVLGQVRYKDTTLKQDYRNGTFITLNHKGSVRGKNGIGDGFSVCCNFSIMSRWIDQLFNQNPTVCCNFPSFPPGEMEKVGHAGSEEGRKENCSKQWDFD